MTGDTLLAGYVISGGSLTGDLLERTGREIWQLMLGQTRGRVVEVDRETPEGQLVQECYNAMVDSSDENAALASETLGQWTRTYRDEEKSREKQLLGILRDYLGETGLLYRGWYG